MPTIFKKIKAKAKSSRGGAAADFIVKQFEEDENIDAWYAGLDGMEQDEKDQVAEDLNECADGLGDAMIEDKAAFKMAKADLSASEMKDFAKKLLDKYFEIEGVDAVEDDD